MNSATIYVSFPCIFFVRRKVVRGARGRIAAWGGLGGLVDGAARTDYVSAIASSRKFPLWGGNASNT